MVVSELKEDVAEMAAAVEAYTASTMTSTSGALSDLLEALRPAPRSLMTELSLVLQMEPAHVMLRPMLMLLFFLPLLLPLLCFSPLRFLLSVAAAGAG